MLPTEKECRQIAERALGYTKATDASVSISFGRNSNTRFANNDVTTSGAAETINVVLSVTRDNRTGRVSLNQIADGPLSREMRRAEELAGLLPPDPEYVGPVPPQKYLAIKAEDPATESFAAADRVPGVKAVKNRIHLDVRPYPGGDQRAEVERLREHGARTADVGQGEVPWVVLADPEGNEFCVLRSRSEGF